MTTYSHLSYKNFSEHLKRNQNPKFHEQLSTNQIKIETFELQHSISEAVYNDSQKIIIIIKAT